MRAFTIPVAIVVQGDDEMDAARILVDILAGHNLTQDHRARAGERDLGPIECWWLPNHPAADISDNEEVLIFAPASTEALLPDERQVLTGKALTFWRQVINAIGWPDLRDV